MIIIDRALRGGRRSDARPQRGDGSATRGARRARRKTSRHRRDRAGWLRSLESTAAICGARDASARLGARTSSLRWQACRVRVCARQFSRARGRARRRARHGRAVRGGVSIARRPGREQQSVIDMSETKRARTKSKLKPKPVHQALAMHSAASPDWGTPMLVRSFSARVLEPAAMGHAIDLDYASSAYWQKWWPDPRIVPTPSSTDRRVATCSSRPTVVPRSRVWAPVTSTHRVSVAVTWSNSAGLFEKDHREAILGSGFWSDSPSSNSVASRTSASETHSPRTWTISSRRSCRAAARTRAASRRADRDHAKEAEASRAKEQAVACRAAADRAARATHGRSSCRCRAPSHLSFVTILWHRDRAVRGAQMDRARQFLKEQHANEKSLLYKYEAIGPLELKSRGPR